MANGGLLENEFEINVEEMLEDELEEGEQNLEGEVEEMLRAWDKDEFEKLVKEELELMKRSKANKDMDFYDGTDFETIARDMTPLEGEQVFIKIIEPNPTGKAINADSTILFDSVSYLEFDPKPFASSIYDGKPTTINLAVGPMTAGMVHALISLREGERANILIYPSMAFGPLGCPPIIPQNSMILCQVKVYKVWYNSKLDSLVEAERREFFEASHDDVIKLVEEHKEIANNYLRDNQYRDALIRYKVAIKRLDEVPWNFLERSNGKFLLQALLQNCAQALNKLEMHKSATKYAKRALLIDPRSLKAYFQLIKARIGVGDLDDAQRQLAKVDMISPHDPCFAKLKIQLDQLSASMKQKRDEIARKMSRGLFSGQ